MTGMIKTQGISSLKIETAFLFVVSHTITISFGRGAGTKNNHNSGDQSQTQQ